MAGYYVWNTFGLPFTVRTQSPEDGPSGLGAMSYRRRGEDVFICTHWPRCRWVLYFRWYSACRHNMMAPVSMQPARYAPSALHELGGRRAHAFAFSARRAHKLMPVGTRSGLHIPMISWSKRNSARWASTLTLLALARLIATHSCSLLTCHVGGRHAVWRVDDYFIMRDDATAEIW